MARFVKNNFDTFLADSDGTNNFAGNGETIRVPHYIGKLIVKQVDDARRHNRDGINKVAWIKFVREWFEEGNGRFLGLKDAKDIVDHYCTIGSQLNHERPAHLQT